MPPTSNRSRRPVWLIYVAMGAVASVVFLLLPPGTLPQDTAYDLVALSAVVAIVAGVRIHRPAHPWPWLLLALGQLSFFVGDIIWVVYQEIGEDPFPSIADAFYLAGYPTMALGLILGIRWRIGSGDRSGLLDASILTTSVVVLAWTFQIGPLAAELDPDPLSLGIALAYPIFDLLLIGVATGLLTTPGGRMMSFRLLMVSLFALLVADQVYAVQSAQETYVDGGALDLGWIVAYVTIGAAALHPTMRAVFEPKPVAVTLLGPVRLLFLAAAMLTGPALLGFATPDPDPGIAVVAAGTAILSVLVLARLAGLVRILAADIAQRRVLEAQLSFQANHDPLTDLANRRLFVARVDERMTSHSPEPFAVLFLDLDDFKTVNDSLGHHAGDRLLKAVGDRLRGSIRDVDVAARLGGDEFGVLLGEIADVTEAESIARRIATMVGVPVALNGTLVPVPVSIGIALRTAEMTTVDDLLHAADVAMYNAKARGKDRSQVYSPKLEATDEPEPDGRVGSRRTTGQAVPRPTPRLRPGTA